MEGPVEAQFRGEDYRECLVENRDPTAGPKQQDMQDIGTNTAGYRDPNNRI